MKKKLMILVVVALFMTLMFSTGCKKKFDIEGTWTLNFSWFTAENSVKSNSTISAMKGSGASATDIIIFTGDKKSGTFRMPDYDPSYTGYPTPKRINIHPMQ